MNKRILVTTQMMIHDQQRFRGWLESLGFAVDFIMSEQFLTEQECLDIHPIYEGWIAGDDQITEKVLRHLSSKLKVISKWGTGIDSINLAAAHKLEVHVANSPGAFKSAVGELAVGYTLALSRGILETHLEVTEGGWPKKQYKDLSDMCIGLIGFGAIGQGVAERLTSFGCSICFCDPIVANSDYKSVKLEDLARVADIFIITASLNDSTRGMIGKSFFNSIKAGSFLINVSRGQLVDETELSKALSTGLLEGAALDVFCDEPLASESSLRTHRNVILGSHNANNTRKAVEYVHQNTIEQLIKYLEC